MQSTTIVRVALAAALAMALGAQAQTVYKWKDKDGKVHFSDTPPNEDTKDLTQRRVGGNYGEDSQLPYATQVAMKRNPVTMFTATDCGTPCERGRELLGKRGIPFTEKNAQTSSADNEALKKLSSTAEVPFLVVGENKIKGYDDDVWNGALDTAGYPRTRLPGQPVPAPVRPPEPAKAPASAPAEPASPTK